MKKITKILLSLFIIFFAFTNSANAIVDTNLNDTKTQTEQTTQKKKFLKRIFTEKNDDKTTSKDEITFKIEEQTNTLNIKENSTLTLDDCIKIALENSPSIQKYQDLVTVANSLLGQSKSSYFPSLTLGTGYYGSYSSSSGRSESDSSYGVDASLKQLIFSFGKVGARIKKAKLNKIAADYDLNYEIIKTIFNVKTNYYAVLAASANIKVQEANILVNERQYQQTKAYFEEGLKSKIDLVNSEVYLSNAKINLVSAQNSYDTAVVALNNSMYLDYSPKYSIAKLENFNFDNKYANVALKHTTQNLEKFEAPVLKEGATYQTIVQKNEILNEAYKVTKFPYTLEDSIKIAKEHRPDLKSYIAAKEALKEELKYQKIQYLPDINAKGGYGLTANDNNTNSFRIQGTLDFPNINVMDIKYKVDEAKAKLNIADIAVNQLSKDIYYNVQKAYVNMVQYEKKIPLTEVAVKQTYENLELAMGRYEVGLGNFLEVQDAIVNYNKAQENYVKLIFDYNVSKAKLELEIAKVDETYVQNNKNSLKEKKLKTKKQRKNKKDN